MIGARRISQFIESLVRLYVLNLDLDAGCRAMAEDTQREAEASQWAEATVGDRSHVARWGTAGEF